MRKISKIFAVVLCLAMALSMICVGVSAAENSVEFTVDSLGLPAEQYSSGTTTVDGIAVEWIQLANYADGGGIQMRDKDDGVKISKFWNTSAAGTGITKIEFTYSEVKDVKYGNEDAVIVNFGNSANGANYSTKLSTTAGVKTYTVTPDANTYTYFYIEHDLSYTFYWKSIKVYYNETESGDNTGSTPVQPEQPEEEPELDIVPISTALAGNDDETFMVEGVVTMVDGKNVYIQDATGGICVYLSAAAEGLNLGDKIIATGSKAVYNGLPELVGTYEVSGVGALTPKEVALDALDTADICTYVKVTGLTVVDYFDNDGAYQYPNITLSDGENEIELYKAVVEDIEIGDVVDVTCALSYYAKGDVEKFQLRNTVVDEVVLATDEPGEVVTPGEGDDNTDDTSDDTNDNTTNNDVTTGEVVPGTSDISVLAAVLVGLCATTALVVVTKKEQ